MGITLYKEVPEGRRIWRDGEAFLRSFTLEERGAIALSTNSTIAALRMLITARKGEVWSDNAEVQFGMAALVSAGIITEERKTEILTP